MVPAIRNNFLIRKARKEREFIKKDIWCIRLEALPGYKAHAIRLARIFFLSIYKFGKDECTLLAAALTLFSLLSVVPMAAMAFGIAKGFGLGAVLRNRLMSEFYGQEQIIDHVIQYAESWLASIKGGVVAGLGALILIYTVIRMLGNIELALNRIWKVRKNRHLGRKVSDYLVVLLVCMSLLIMSSSITIFITAQVKLMIRHVSILETVGPFILFFIKLIPYALMWILFTIIYSVIPNTRVDFKAAIPAAVIGGTLFQMAQWAMIALQLGVGRYNVVYGSFAAFPIFLIWLQISWIIFLFGAELVFAFQNIDAYEYAPDCRRVSSDLKKRLHLVVMHLLVRNFAEGANALTESEIADRTRIPLCLVQDILDELVEAGLLIKTDCLGRQDAAYQPAVDTDQMNLHTIIDCLERKGLDHMPIAETEVYRVIGEKLQTCTEQAKACMADVRLKDLKIS